MISSKEMTGRETQAQVVSARIGDPVPVVLKSGQPVQTIFAVREDRSVSGADYPAGDNCLALLCSLDADNPDRIILTGVPQIRGMERKTAYGRQGEEFILRTQEELYNFDAMMFRVSLPVHGILVIGPGGEARRESSVGHHFLVERKGGVEYEIVLVLMADVSRLPAKRPQ
jgi:hypothetical protein